MKGLLISLLCSSSTTAFTTSSSTVGLIRSDVIGLPLYSISPPAASENIEQKQELNGVRLTSTAGAMSLTISELAEVMGGRGRALLAWDCYANGIDPALFFADPVDLGEDTVETLKGLFASSRRGQRLGKGALERLSSLYNSYTPSRVEGGVATLSHISQSRDSTTKLLLRLSDGLEVETVIIPWTGGRSTLCVSSQVGCRQGKVDDTVPPLFIVHRCVWRRPQFRFYNYFFVPGCTFCATGRMGKLRSLNADEILAQLFFARKICRQKNLPPVTNVVFMGMGEPADNKDAVIRATDIMTTRELFQLSASKVTVSTVAPTPDSFLQFAHAHCVLAWSVHAANDELRRQLVPTTKHAMTELRQGLIDTLLIRPHNFRTTMLEVALVSGINDSEKEADELVDFAQVIIDEVPGCKLVVNLIPFNDIGQNRYTKPSMEAVSVFQKRLREFGLVAHIRTTRGDDESAACGQLATNKQKQRVF
jgi:23S rRNA (adenine2503-C2)-methyltransferase